MKRLWKILGILLGTALLLNVVTEILNRKSFVGTVRFMIHGADGILAGYAAASGPVSAGIFYKAQSIFGGCVLGDRLCCGNYQ